MRPVCFWRENCGRRRPARGFTLFEFAVVVAIVGVLGGTLLNRIIFYQEQAELAAMQQVVGSLRSALHLKISKLYVSNRAGELPALLEQNPMDWLAEKPYNYVGEFFLPDSKEVPSGNWYFDKKEKKLVYLFGDGKNFQNSRSAMLKFKVKLSTTIGKASSFPAEMEGIVLDQVND